jgi:hypothetical protein
MELEKTPSGVKILLTPQEAKLLSWALERASFIDTPQGEQARIAEFCSHVLEELGRVGG